MSQIEEALSLLIQYHIMMELEMDTHPDFISVSNQLEDLKDTMIEADRVYIENLDNRLLGVPLVGSIKKLLIK